MNDNRLSIARETTYYIAIALVVLLAIISVYVAVLSGITRDRYVSSALALSLVVTVACVIMWIGHHLEIKRLNSIMSRLIWTGVIAGLITPVPTVILAGNQSAIDFQEMKILDPSAVVYRKEDSGRPYLRDYIPLLGSIISYPLGVETAIPILFTVENYSVDLDGRPDITFTVIIKNKQTEYAVVEDFPEPMRKVGIAGDYFLSPDTLAVLKTKNGLDDKSCGVFMILDQLKERINVSGEILIRIIAKDNLSGKSVYKDTTINLRRVTI